MKLTLPLALLVLCCGCESLNPRPPVEAFAQEFAEKIIEPAVAQGLTNGVQNLGIHASAQGINPTYVIKFRGLWVTGIDGEASVGVQGIAGQMSIATQAAPPTSGLPAPME